MARAQYGAIITDIKGKMGGTIFKGTKAGPVMQNKTKKSGSPTTAGKLSKADAGRALDITRFTSIISSSWKTLAEEEITAWNNAAPSFPFTNKFGNQYTGSGFQLYMQCNLNLLLIGASVITEPPAVEEILDCPPFEVAAATGTSMSLTMSGGIPTGYALTISASFPQSAGRGFEKGRIKAIVTLDSPGTFPYDMNDDYVKVFGIVQVGGNIYFSGKLTKADAGRALGLYRIPYVIPAPI